MSPVTTLLLKLKSDPRYARDKAAFEKLEEITSDRAALAPTTASNLFPVSPFEDEINLCSTRISRASYSTTIDEITNLGI